MNELELLASLRAEVPAPDSAPVEHAVMTALREQDRHPVAGRRRTQDAGQRRPSSREPGPPRAPPLGAASTGRRARARSRRGRLRRGGSGRLPGDPACSQPAPGGRLVRAADRTLAGQAQLRAGGQRGGVGRLRDPRCCRARDSPKPGEWVVVKTEFADSSGGGGGYLFGPAGRAEGRPDVVPRGRVRGGFRPERRGEPAARPHRGRPAHDRSQRRGSGMHPRLHAGRMEERQLLLPQLAARPTGLRWSGSCWPMIRPTGR